MTNGEINFLTRVRRKVDGILMPIALTVFLVFGSQCPFLQDNESRWGVIDRHRKGYGKMFSRVCLIHGTSPKANHTALRNVDTWWNKKVIGSKWRSGCIVIGIRNQHTIGAATAHAVHWRQLPVVVITIGIDKRPVEQATFNVVLFKVPCIGTIGRIDARGVIKHIARGRNIVFNALLGFRSKGSGHQ